VVDPDLRAEPHDSGWLDVGDGQEMYWEVVGDPHGRPALYLHGGPGAGSSPRARSLFHPSYRAVLFDQRGCGRSRPSAPEATTDLHTNTTEHLLRDIESLREHLSVERWVVAGVSWGVTLALAYALRHPERVSAMVLGAVTTGTQAEIEWITRGMRRFFPAEWERFAALVGAAEDPTMNVPAAYARLLGSQDLARREAAAREWCVWEDTHVSLMPGWEPDPRFADPRFRMTFARLVTHYWSNRCFLQGGEISKNVHRLRGIPATLVHGRHDVSGPLDTAYDLARAWPEAELVVIEGAATAASASARR
jgi:proline iminopeptidase